MKDRRKLFPTLTPPERALALLKSRLPRGFREEEVELERAVWHIASESIRARVSYPREPRATADGYALRYECVASASEASPVRLPLIERVRVGEVPSKTIRGCEAIEVDTGAAIPAGANAVVPVEYTRETDGVVEVYRNVGFGENIAWPGSDIVEGEVVVEKGSLLTPQLVGALAASGVDRVAVYAKPRVCVIPTGVELVPPGGELKPGHVYEADSYILYALLTREGFPATRHDIVPDDEDLARKALRECLGSHDVVLFTGGTSAGPMDVVYRVIETEGELLVHGLKLKPGKPTALGIVDDKLVAGLPGNPVSALNVYNVVIRPLLWHLAGGEPPTGGGKVKAKLLAPIASVRGRRLYQPVNILECSHGYCAAPIPFESYMIVTYSRSDGYTVVPEDVHEMLPEGEVVDVEVFEFGKARMPTCIGEEVGDEQKLGCRFIGGGTTLAVRALEYRANAIVTLSTKHPSYSITETHLPACSEVVRRLALVGSRKPRILALPPPSTSLRYLTLELVESYEEVVPARSSLMAALLVKQGYADSALVLEEHAERYNLEKLEVVEERLVRCRVSPGGGSSQP